MLGRKLSKNTRFKMSNGSRKGSNNPTWKGGKPKCPTCSKIIWYTSKYCRKCCPSDLEKNPNWQGGTSVQAKYKRATRPKPETCEICGGIGKICFDHCHKTGRFRGWICSPCNLALGIVKDDISKLSEMIEYLKKNN